MEDQVNDLLTETSNNITHLLLTQLNIKVNMEVNSELTSTIFNQLEILLSNLGQ